MVERNRGGAGRTQPARALTDRTLKSLHSRRDPYRVPDSKTRGLAARVATDGQITWDLSYRISGTGKVRRTSLGKWPEDRSLQEARERADEITRAGRLGRDLLKEEGETRLLAEKRVTVGMIIEMYLRRRVVGRLRTASDIERRLNRALAPIKGKAAEDIRKRDIRELLDEIADQGHSREADKRRQVISTMFTWALSVDLIESNPLVGLPRYGGSRTSDRVLSEREIRILWHWLPHCGMPEGHADVLRLCLAFGARCGEIAGLRADEIDTESRVWTLPGERSKNGKPRTTPLNEIAWSVLAPRLHIEKGVLFATSTGRALAASNIGQSLNVRARPIDHFTTHDLRRTVASQMVEMGIGLEMVASVLGHTAGGASVATLTRHYVRAEQLEAKRIALESWSARLQAIIGDKASSSRGNVIALGA